MNLAGGLPVSLSYRETIMQVLTNAEIEQVSGGIFKWSDLGGAMAGGAITGGLAGLAADGIGFLPGAAGGALLGGISYIAAEEF